jgi:hypothetical protein
MTYVAIGIGVLLAFMGFAWALVPGIERLIAAAERPEDADDPESWS